MRRREFITLLGGPDARRLLQCMSPLCADFVAKVVDGPEEQ